MLVDEGELGDGERRIRIRDKTSKEPTDRVATKTPSSSSSDYLDLHRFHLPSLERVRGHRSFRYGQEEFDANGRP